MKFLNLFIYLCFCCLILNAQHKDIVIPQKVRAAFNSAYPNATAIKWEKEKKDYEAGFMLGAKHLSVLYTAAGELKEIETRITEKDLPEAARKLALSKGTIKEAAKIQTAIGQIKYEAEVNGKDLLFDEKGNMIQ